jgi:hypothetical protein
MKALFVVGALDESPQETACCARSRGRTRRSPLGNRGDDAYDNRSLYCFVAHRLELFRRA